MKHKTILIFIITYIFNGNIIHGGAPVPVNQCCDELNNNTLSNECTCSDQTGGVGTCNCSSSPNTRQGWLCKNDANGDSVNINKESDFDSNF